MLEGKENNMEYVTKDYILEKGFSKEESRQIMLKARDLMKKEKMYVPFTRPYLVIPKYIERILKGEGNETTN